MIQTKQDLKYYLECDRQALGINRRKPRLIGDSIWKYQRLYRKTEYWWNNRSKNPAARLMAVLYRYYYRYRSVKWGNEIPVNCIEEGLCIWHGQNIIINPKARLGKWCSLSTGVIIGHAHEQCPVIGDRVKISVDAKVLGGIKICDDVVIGAGAVVVKNIDVPFSSWGGVPARMLSVQKENQ